MHNWAVFSGSLQSDLLHIVQLLESGKVFFIIIEKNVCICLQYFIFPVAEIEEGDTITVKAEKVKLAAGEKVQEFGENCTLCTCNVSLCFIVGGKDPLRFFVYI